MGDRTIITVITIVFFDHVTIRKISVQLSMLLYCAVVQHLIWYNFYTMWNYKLQKMTTGYTTLVWLHGDI